MNRRHLIRNLTLAAGAMMLVPSCVSDPRKVSIALTNLDITPDEEELLATLAETIIPKTDKAGARDVGAHHYALVMVDDCFDEALRAEFLSGLRLFDEEFRKVSSSTFMKAGATSRVDGIGKIDSDRELVSAHAATFYDVSKRFIVQGYTTSEYYLTNVKPYKLIPGPDFKGCIPA